MLGFYGESLILHTSNSLLTNELFGLKESWERHINNDPSESGWGPYPQNQDSCKRGEAVQKFRRQMHILRRRLRNTKFGSPQFKPWGSQILQEMTCAHLHTIHSTYVSGSYHQLLPCSWSHIWGKGHHSVYDLEIHVSHYHSQFYLFTPMGHSSISKPHLWTLLTLSGWWENYSKYHVRWFQKLKSCFWRVLSTWYKLCKYALSLLRQLGKSELPGTQAPSIFSVALAKRRAFFSRCIQHFIQVN